MHLFILCFIFNTSLISQEIVLDNFYLDSTIWVRVSQNSSNFSRTTTYEYDEQFRLTKRKGEGSQDLYTYDENVISLSFYNNGDHLTTKRTKFNESGIALTEEFYVFNDNDSIIRHIDTFQINNSNLHSEWNRTSYEFGAFYNQGYFKKEYDDKQRLIFQKLVLYYYPGTQTIKDQSIHYQYDEHDRLIRTEIVYNNNSAVDKTIESSFYTGPRLDSTKFVTKDEDDSMSERTETFTDKVDFLIKRVSIRSFKTGTLIDIDTSTQIHYFSEGNTFYPYSKVQEYKMNSNGVHILINQDLYSESITTNEIILTHVSIKNQNGFSTNSVRSFYKRKMPLNEKDPSDDLAQPCIFPNPVFINTSFQISSSIGFQFIQIYNSIGQLIRHEKINLDQEFDVPNQAGIYYILLLDEHKEVVLEVSKLLVIQN